MSYQGKSRLDQFADAVHAKLDDSTVLQMMGETAKRENEQIRRIIWSRTQKACKAYRNATASGSKESADKKTTQVQGFERFEIVEFTIHAKTPEELDDLFDALLSVFEKLPRLIVMDDGVDYVITEHKAHTERNPMLVGEVKIRVPVATETKQLVIIQTNKVTCSIKPTGPLHGPDFFPPES